MDKSIEQLVDEILVMDGQRGKVKALEILVSRWQKRLWQYAFHLTRNTDAAWDVTQESWLGIIKGLRKLHDPSNFKAWAYRITTNKAMNWIKNKKAFKQVGIEEIQDRQYKETKDTDLKELTRTLYTEPRRNRYQYKYTKWGPSGRLVKFNPATRKSFSSSNLITRPCQPP